jgi:hypothetical protein
MNKTFIFKSVVSTDRFANNTPRDVDNCLILKGVLHNNFILFTGTQINMLISTGQRSPSLLFLVFKAVTFLLEFLSPHK